MARRSQLGIAASVFVWSALAAGCGDDVTPFPDDFPDYPPPGSREMLAVGTGEAAFVDFEEGATLPLVAGFQGGWHVWISLRAPALARTGRWWLLLELDDTAGVLGLQRSGPLRIPPDPSGAIVGWPAQLEDPGCWVGKEVTLRALVVDEANDWGETTRSFVVGPGSDPPGGCD